MRVVGHGHALFLHRLQEGGLSFWRGAVDFVCQEDVAEHRSGLVFKNLGSVSLDENLSANNVGRQQVGGKLHPLKLQVEGFGNGIDQGGFPQARHPFQQHVTAHSKNHRQ